jgi:galactokinase
MLDIGPIHRKEYELEDDRSEPVAIAEAPGDGAYHKATENKGKEAGVFVGDKAKGNRRCQGQKK